MWQCISVKKIVARFLPLLLITAYTQAWIPTHVLAQANIGYNRVSSTRVNKSASSVTLITDNRTTIPRPIIRYLPGQSGDTILVADFPGLIWHQATKVIEVNSSFANRFATNVGIRKKGIKLVRIGKFQDMPPVLRVAIISNDANKLKSVAFSSKPGKLTVRWSKSLKTIRKAPPIGANSRSRRNLAQTAATAPPLAPPIGALDPALAESGPQIALKPPISLKATPDKPIPTAPPKAKKGFFSKLFKKVKGSYKKALTPVNDPAYSNDDNKGENKAETASSPESTKNGNIPEKQPPVIYLSSSQGDNLTINVKDAQGKKLVYSKFRLNNPDRLVIDFNDLEEIANATTPNLSSNKYIKGIRVGSPKLSDDKKIGRLVLDLEQSDVEITETENNNILALSVGPSTDTLNGLYAPAGSTVVIDAGHGGSDPGAQRGSFDEKDITLSIANKTYKYLTKKGVKVIRTRPKDVSVSLQDRVATTNRIKPDLFLSIHVNSLESRSDIEGIETYYQTPQSQQLAKTIHKTLVSDLEAPDRSIRKARFYVVNRTKVPAVLSEVGFISHKKERSKLVSDAYQEKVAKALAKGVILHLKENNMIARSNKTAKNLSNSSVTSPSKVSKVTGQPGRGRGTISRVSRLAQRGLGIKTK